MIGIDLLNLERVRLNEALIQHVLTEKEQAAFIKLRTEAQRIAFLGGRICAKEALFKATQDPAYLTFSILNDASGKPYVDGHPEMEISIAHEAAMAVAIVLVRA